MAKTSMINKQQKEPKFSTRAYTRCRLCGRPHSVLRKYGVCRICFRELAYKGEIPGVRKALDSMSEIVEAVRGMDISLSDLAAFLKAARASATSGIGVPAKPASWGEEEQTERTDFGGHAAEGVERSLQRRGPKATGSIGKEDSEE